MRICVGRNGHSIWIQFKLSSLNCIESICSDWRISLVLNAIEKERNQQNRLLSVLFWTKALFLRSVQKFMNFGYANAICIFSSLLCWSRLRFFNEFFFSTIPLWILIAWNGKNLQWPKKKEKKWSRILTMKLFSCLFKMQKVNAKTKTIECRTIWRLNALLLIDMEVNL